jgi:hypothetical protein
MPADPAFLPPGGDFESRDFESAGHLPASQHPGFLQSLPPAPELGVLSDTPDDVDVEQSAFAGAL